jgi:hypothetical protein
MEDAADQMAHLSEHAIPEALKSLYSESHTPVMSPSVSSMMSPEPWSLCQGV